MCTEKRLLCGVQEGIFDAAMKVNLAKKEQFELDHQQSAAEDEQKQK